MPPGVSGKKLVHALLHAQKWGELRYGFESAKRALMMGNAAMKVLAKHKYIKSLAKSTNVMWKGVSSLTFGFSFLLSFSGTVSRQLCAFTSVVSTRGRFLD